MGGDSRDVDSGEGGGSGSGDCLNELVGVLVLYLIGLIEPVGKIGLLVDDEVGSGGEKVDGSGIVPEKGRDIGDPELGSARELQVSGIVSVHSCLGKRVCEGLREKKWGVRNWELRDTSKRKDSCSE